MLRQGAGRACPSPCLRLVDAAPSRKRLSPLAGVGSLLREPALGEGVRLGCAQFPAGLRLLETQGRTLSWGSTARREAGSPGPPGRAGGTAVAWGRRPSIREGWREPGTRAAPRTQPASRRPPAAPSTPRALPVPQGTAAVNGATLEVLTTSLTPSVSEARSSSC